MGRRRKAGIMEKAIARAVFSGNMSIERANEVYREGEKAKKSLREMIEDAARNEAQITCDRELNKRFSEGE